MKPFIKWAGGKAKLAPKLATMLPERIGTYHEPFLGGGALFFELASNARFCRARLSDSNPDLIACWRQVERGATELLEIAESYGNDEESYYAIRKWIPDPDAELSVAARFLYLNKQGFNGLWRVNRAGHCNVPWGKKPRPCGDLENMRACEAALAESRVTIHRLDFEAATAFAREGDAVYFDPPYPPTSKTANFTAYDNGWKGWEDHVRLRACADRLANRGVAVLVSNADLLAVRELWSGWEIESVSMRRNINSDGAKRAPVGELVIRNGMLI